MSTIVILLSNFKKTEQLVQQASMTKTLTAVFRASWFNKLAGGTGDAWVKQPPVIWIDMQLACYFLLCDCACQS